MVPAGQQNRVSPPHLIDTHAHACLRDGDGSMDPRELPAMITNLAAGADPVLGQRSTVAAGRFARSPTSKVTADGIEMPQLTQIPFVNDRSKWRSRKPGVQFHRRHRKP